MYTTEQLPEDFGRKLVRDRGEFSTPPLVVTNVIANTTGADEKQGSKHVHYCNMEPQYQGLVTEHQRQTD